ncbi:MAG TPA: hypothetical protein VGI60_09555 [Chthoniobacterales bacterium]|jgi:hypothetical protein
MERLPHNGRSGKGYRTVTFWKTDALGPALQKDSLETSRNETGDEAGVSNPGWGDSMAVLQKWVLGLIRYGFCAIAFLLSSD